MGKQVTIDIQWHLFLILKKLFIKFENIRIN